MAKQQALCVSAAQHAASSPRRRALPCDIKAPLRLAAENYLKRELKGIKVLQLRVNGMRDRVPGGLPTMFPGSTAI